MAKKNYKSEANNIIKSSARVHGELDDLWDRVRLLIDGIRLESTRVEQLAIIDKFEPEIELYNEIAGIASGLQESVAGLISRKLQIQAELDCEAARARGSSLGVEREDLNTYEVTGKLGGYTVELVSGSWEVAGDDTSANGSYASLDDALYWIDTIETTEIGRRELDDERRRDEAYDAREAAAYREEISE